MNIIITGATGFIGKQLVPLLNFKTNEIALFGRDIKKLNEIYPQFMVYEYKDLERVINKNSIILHLAVKNNRENNNKKNLRDYLKVNVMFTKKLYKIAMQARIKKFLNLSTTNILNENKKDPYSMTKRKLVNNIKNKENLKFINLIMPIVYGKKFTGRLSFLNMFPRSFSFSLMKFISAFKSTMNIKLLADYINEREFMKNNCDIILTDGQNNNIFFKIFKKMIDLFFSISILFFFSWLILIISIFIKISSNGPILFVHKRIGKNNVIFSCYKFRTMKQATPISATHKIKKKQVTYIGKFLRKTKLDEIPQVINILKGDMSLIGPRPCIVSQKDIIKVREKYKINKILPGITGLAQINRIDMSDKNMLTKFDYRYLKLRSIISELNIILRTFIGYGSGDNTIN